MSILPISIHPIQKSFVSQIIKISEQQLGSSFLHEEDLFGSDIITYCALYMKDVVGFCVGRIFQNKDFITEYSDVMHSFRRAYHVFLTSSFGYKNLMNWNTPQETHLFFQRGSSDMEKVA